MSPGQNPDWLLFSWFLSFQCLNNELWFFKSVTKNWFTLFHLNLNMLTKDNTKNSSHLKIFCLKNFLEIFWNFPGKRLFLKFGLCIFILLFLPIQGSRAENHWVAPRLTQLFILPKSIRWVPEISENLVVKSKLPPQSGSSLETVEHHPSKGA